jgi:hypothetical protein
MADLVRDPATGQYSFRDPTTAVINQTTGQTANTLTATPTATVTAPPAITPSAITGTESPYKASAFIQDAPPDTTGYDKLISDLMAGNTAEQTQAQDAQKSTLQTIQDTMSRLLGEGQKKADLETQAGLPDIQKQLNETLGQIRQNNAGAFGASQQQEDRLAPTFAIQGTQAQIERQRAVKNYGLAAVAETLQGNIALAQDNIQRALDAEFKPLEKVLEYQKLFLEQNRSDLERADKKTADKLSIILAERERALNQQKEDRTAIQTMALSAIKNNPNNPLVSAAAQKAMASNSLREAFDLVGQYQNDPNTTAKAVAELEQTRAQTKLLYANYDKSLAEQAKIYSEMLNPQPKEAKEYQYKANLFAGRTLDSDKILNSLESKITGMNAAVFANQSGLENTTIGNAFVSSDIQQWRQAERNFLNAVLRRESGAVISPSEFAEGAKQYFPRPGDDAEVLRNKSANRQRQIQGLESEAGPAYTPIIDVTETVRMKSADGSLYDVPKGQIDRFKQNGYTEV